MMRRRGGEPPEEESSSEEEDAFSALSSRAAKGNRAVQAKSMPKAATRQDQTQTHTQGSDK